MQWAEGSVSGPSRFSNRGQDNFTELPAKNRIEPSMAAKPAKRRGISALSLPQDPPRQLGFEADRLLLGDLVELHSPLEVGADPVHPGRGIRHGTEDN